jgi:hypothetical protein
VTMPDPSRPTCGRWMRNVRDYCGRAPGHKQGCRTRATMDAETARRRLLYIQRDHA